jgi:hypothetical protein
MRHALDACVVAGADGRLGPASLGAGRLEVSAQAASRFAWFFSSPAGLVFTAPEKGPCGWPQGRCWEWGQSLE